MKYTIFLILVIYLFLTSCKNPVNSGRNPGQLQQVPVNKLLINKTNKDYNLRIDCDSCLIGKFRMLFTDNQARSEKRISDFLLCCNSNCFNNVEFSEFSNALLFVLLQNNASIIVSILEQNDSINIQFILSELQSPVNEGIDIEKTIGSVESVKMKSTLKDKILEALKNAQGKRIKH
jgi:hypothetical protein